LYENMDLFFKSKNISSMLRQNLNPFCKPLTGQFS